MILRSLLPYNWINRNIKTCESEPNDSGLIKNGKGEIPLQSDDRPPAYVGIDAGIVRKSDLKKDYIEHPGKLIGDINRLGDRFGCTVQIYNTNNILSPEHLFFGCVMANGAFHSGNNLSRNPAIECLLYVSQQRQINVAIDTVGFHPDSGKDPLYISITVMGTDPENITECIKTIRNLIGYEPDIETLSKPPYDKVKTLKELYKIFNYELINSLVCFGYPSNTETENLEILELTAALMRCILERMVTFYIENIKTGEMRSQ